VWERQYSEALTRFEAHQKQIAEARAAEATAAEETSYSSDSAPATTSSSTSTSTGGGSSSRDDSAATGTLATDEALAALREKLAGGRS
jgi:small subunit ribosomal protein S1